MSVRRRHRAKKQHLSRKLARIGYCARCLTWCSTLTRHHLVPKCTGGSLRAANIVMLCHECHVQVHRGKYTWAWEIHTLRAGKAKVLELETQDRKRRAG